MEKTCEPGNSLSGNFRQTEETKLKMRVFARNFSSKKSRVCAHLRIFSPENSSVHFLALFHFSAGKTAFFGSSFWRWSDFFRKINHHIFEKPNEVAPFLFKFMRKKFTLDFAKQQHTSNFERPRFPL